MRLKKIVIIGFKSFADRTILRFDLGMTAIVGPNGCGKSNVADAFRWVMGEQSARSLRGNKMPDVIFAGTSQRKPLNFAEVSITLTDIAGKLPVAYDEVEVTRRLHRSGESEYLINKQPVRLKDVQDLLLDSGIGNDAYAIFEQGKIDEVIKLPPMERRYIFEEAAGIKRFLQRKKEALRKLEQTKGNIDRVKDLHREIERQVTVLEKQAEEAKEFKHKKAELEELERYLLAEKWFDWERRKATLQEKIDGVDASAAEIAAKNEGIQSAQQQAKQLLMESDQVLREQSEMVFRQRSAKEIHGKERENCIVRIEELHQKEERWGKELKLLDQRREAWHGEKESIGLSLKTIETQYAAQEKVVEEHRQQVAYSEDSVGKQRGELQKKQKALVDSLHKLQAAQGELKQLEIRIENGKEREKYLRSRKQLLSEQQKSVEALAKECQSNFEQLLGTIEEKRGVLAAFEVQLTDTVAQLDDVEGQLEKLTKDLTDARARYKALKSLQEHMEGFSSGAQELLTQAQAKGSPVYNKVKALYPYFVAKKGAEKAIAAVMDAYGQTLVAETEEDYNDVVEFAKKKKIDDFSLICVDALKSKKAKASKTAQLIDYVEESALAQHFLSQISLDRKETPSVGFDGVYTDSLHVTFFPKVAGGSVFLRESEIKELAKSVASMEKDQAQLEQVVRSLLDKRKELQGEIIATDKAIRQLEIKSAELNIALQRYGLDRTRIEAERTKIEGEIEATAENIKTHTQNQAAYTKNVAEQQNEGNEVQKNVDTAAARYEELTQEAKKQTNALRQVEQTWQKILDDKRKQQAALHVIDVKEAESLQQQKRIEEELETGRALLEKLTEKREELAKILKGDEKAFADSLKAKEESEKVVIKRQQEISGLQIKTETFSKDLRKNQEQRHQFNVQMAQTDVQMQGVANELLQRHNIELSALADLPRPGKSVDLLEASVKRLRHDLEASATINMTSIEEYERCQVRYKEIASQLTDMGSAEGELLAIIAELDGESRQLFQKTFVKIRENFQKNFTILFTGGEADLQFVDSDDILEAGIEIVAKPPGKQMRSINLLSGGEKCLTALALLFAIFEVKPSPFCILDEIDAPLDDANVDRFVNIVKKFAEICQFIVITHNKRTMTIADTIFGVSMEEKGVSKLLSIDLTTHKSQAEYVSV